MRRLAWVAVLLSLSVAAVLAVHDLDVFELDGNALDETESAPDDWNSLFPIDSSPNELAKVFKADGNNPPVDATYFTGGGSKDINDINQWMHTTTDQAPDKDEISNAYAAAYQSGTDLLFYFGADRFANNGDSQIGFWFFQNPISLNTNGTFSGVHVPGDLLVLSDFTRGGRISTIKVFAWVGSGGSDGSLDLVGSGVDCTTPELTGDDVCATVNSSTTEAPWAYIAKFPPPAPNADNFPSGSFYEGGINVSDLLGETPCFSSFLAETRSSQSVNAQLKDFALGQFALCDARIQITPDAANEVGTDHDLTITVEKKDSSTNFLFDSASGVTATASLTNSDGATAAFVGSNECVTDGNGTCTVTINSPTAGSTTVSGTAEVTLSDGTVLTRTTDGTGQNSSAATKLWADAQIDLSPLTDTNEVNELHTITATVQQDDGVGTDGDEVSGFGPAPDGTLVTFSLFNNSAGAAFDGGNTCNAIGGSCSVDINTSTAGSVDIHATTTFTVGGVSLTRQTDGLLLNSADANKVYVDAQIDLSPLIDTNGVNQAHTITATVQQNDGLAMGVMGGDAVTGFGPAPNGTLVTFSLLNNSAGAAFVSGTNTCTTTGGSCSVQINTSTPGSVDIHATTTFSVGGVSLTRETGSGGLNSADANKVYVDAQIDLSPLIDTNGVNQAHTITATVQQNDGLAAGGDGVAGFGPASNGTLVTFSLLNNSAGAAFVSGTNTCTTTLGTCSVHINTSTAGSVDIHATTTFSVGGVSLTRATGSGGLNSPDANKVYVDAQIDLSPLVDTNSVNEAHTITATVQQNDGLAVGGDSVAGFGPAPNGTLVTFSLLNNTAGAAFVSGNTCATTGGSCSVQINTSTAGSVNIHATTTFSVGGVSLTRATGSGGLNSADANKVFVAGSLRWLKQNGSGGALAGATFEVCRTHNFDSGGSVFIDIVDVCVTVLDNSPPDAHPDPGELQLNGLTLGIYSIEETVPPPGFQGDPFVGTLELSLTAVSVTASHIWVNIGAGEGCTPGFWKNHQPLWDGVPPDVTNSVQTTDLFNATFGVTFARSGLSNSVNLLTALSVSGSDLMALNRHAAAALVNSDSGIAFGLSSLQVIALYRDAVGADPGPETIASALATLSAANEQGCPLN